MSRTSQFGGRWDRGVLETADAHCRHVGPRGTTQNSEAALRTSQASRVPAAFPSSTALGTREVLGERGSVGGCHRRCRRRQLVRERRRQQGVAVKPAPSQTVRAPLCRSVLVAGVRPHVRFWQGVTEVTLNLSQCSQTSALETSHLEQFDSRPGGSQATCLSCQTEFQFLTRQHSHTVTGTIRLAPLGCQRAEIRFANKSLFEQPSGTN